MSKAVAGKKAIAVNRHGLVKKTMIKNEANEVNAPMKKKIPAKKTTPTKLPVAKDTKDNAAVIITKPVLETVPGDKCNPETKPAAIKQEEGVIIKAPETTKSKSEVTKNIDVKKSLSSSVEGQDQGVVKEEKVEDSKEQASTNEYQELNPLLSCSLNSELEEIMIKVWQELPDLPSSKEEELVIEKLRNEAGDDLRNVIGLNITKRLLNMHDSLYAKLYFKTRPERGTLVQFIKKYNLKSFKRIRDDAPVFAAQFNNTDDFDRICNDEEVYCGQVKVQVRPCYNFKTCPPNLRSIFTDKNFENKTNNDRAEGSVDKLKRQQPKTKESLENKECEKKQDDTNKNETTKESEIKTSKENSNTNKQDSVDRIVVKLEKGVNNIKKEKADGSIKKDDKLNESQTESNSQKDIENDKTDKNNIETKEIVVKKEIEEIEKVESKVKDKDTKEGKENDDIEVQDVQALILEGIVLDECTGSDAE